MILCLQVLQFLLQLLQFYCNSVEIRLQLPNFSPWNLELELQLLQFFYYLFVQYYIEIIIKKWTIVILRKLNLTSERNCNLVAIFHTWIAILLQLIAILKISNIDNCNFDPIFLEVAIHYFGVAIIAIVNVYTNVYKLLYYISKVQYVKWHISMSRLPPIFAKLQYCNIIHIL